MTIDEIKAKKREIRERLNRGEAVAFSEFPDEPAPAPVAIKAPPATLKTGQWRPSAATRGEMMREVEALRAKARSLLSAADRLQEKYAPGNGIPVPHAAGFEADPTDLLAAAAQAFHVTKARLLSRVRDDHTAMARHVAMYLMRACTPYSYPFIGELFGRDHTTVFHGYNRIARRMAAEPPFANFIHDLLAAVPLIETPAAAMQEVAA